MSDVDPHRLEGLIFLNQLHFDRFQARRQWEWRLTFTLWGGLAASANALRDVENLPFPVYLAFGGLVVVLHYIWERFIQRETYRNRIFGVRLGSELLAMINFDPGDDDDGFPLNEVREHRKAYAHYWQVAITVILVAVVGAVLYL